MKLLHKTGEATLRDYKERMLRVLVYIQHISMKS